MNSLKRTVCSSLSKSLYRCPAFVEYTANEVVSCCLMWLFRIVARLARGYRMLTTKTLLVIIVILGSAIVVKAGVYYSADTPARAIHERYTVRESVVVLMNRRRSIRTPRRVEAA